MKRVLAVACLVVVGAMASYGTIIYQDNCSTANGWHNIGDAGNSTFSSDGSTVSFTEPDGGVSPGNGVTWGTSHMAFDPSLKSYYTLTIDVLSLTDSASYKFALDTFDSSHNWIETLPDLYPTDLNRATDGVGGPATITLDVNRYTYNANTAYIAPKFDLTTGNPAQTLKIDTVTLDQAAVPEPASAAMMIGAGLSLVLIRKARSVKT